MKKLLIFLLSVALAGCGQDNADSTYKDNQDRAGEDLITNREQGDFTNQPGGDMTMGDQNPNLLNTDNQNRHNFSQDVQKAKDVITARGHEPGQIWINGSVMSVTAKTRLSGKKRNSEEKELREQLAKALPRYEINIEME